jgi:aspartyl-tRNA(Asn)/glutamyl-tRNA(Gln) amidotransferase subunit A
LRAEQPAIAAIAEQIASGATTSTALTERTLDALRGVVAEHNGLATTLPERARAAAMEADRRRTAVGSSALLGVPFAVKDTFAAAGAPTTWGSPYFAEQVFDRDAEVIGRLEATGAVLTAKLAMSELAGFGGPVAAGASLHGVPRNPWRPDTYAGGSSGGSAIAVACDVVPFALGTETGGSVTGPAALCGITGLRPSPGRISRDGMLTLSPTLDKVGIMARTARDCATVFEVLRQSSEPIDAAALRSPRIGVITDESDDWDDDLLPALTAALAQFTCLGTVTPLSREVLGQPNLALLAIMAAEAAHQLRRELADPAFALLDAGQDEGLRSGLRLPAVEYLAARDTGGALGHALSIVFSGCDVIVAATRSDTARPIGAGRPAGGRTVANLLRAAANLIGLPGVSVPAGLSTHGLPVGLHIVTAPGRDELALGLAARFQDNTTHHELRPSLAASTVGP